MTAVEDNWTPTPQETEEALELYNQWLTEASATAPSKEEAYQAVENSFLKSDSHHVYAWLTHNRPDSIYDIDEALASED